MPSTAPGMAAPVSHSHPEPRPSPPCGPPSTPPNMEALLEHLERALPPLAGPGERVVLENSGAGAGAAGTGLSGAGREARVPWQAQHPLARGALRVLGVSAAPTCCQSAPTRDLRHARSGQRAWPHHPGYRRVRRPPRAGALLGMTVLGTPTPQSGAAGLRRQPHRPRAGRAEARQRCAPRPWCAPPLSAPRRRHSADPGPHRGAQAGRPPRRQALTRGLLPGRPHLQARPGRGDTLCACGHTARGQPPCSCAL